MHIVLVGGAPSIGWRVDSIWETADLALERAEEVYDQATNRVMTAKVQTILFDNYEAPILRSDLMGFIQDTGE